MKEKDLDKNLENIIIDGLIKEAEQDNADFAATMRSMSDEEFEEMVYQPVFADSGYDDDTKESSSLSYNMMSASLALESEVCEPAEEYDNKPKKSRLKILRPWIAAAISSAAVILLVLIPSINSMNAKLCDSALYMSEVYITAPKGGFDISTASTDRIKQELPNLEKQYKRSLEQCGTLADYQDGVRDAGWTLAVAYLKLHRKNDAMKVLKTLEFRSQGTPFGDHCAKMLKQLD